MTKNAIFSPNIELAGIARESVEASHLVSCAVQQTSRLLLDRLQLLGEGAAEAAARRDKAVMLEAVAARERRAQDACARQCRGIVRRGFGLL